MSIEVRRLTEAEFEPEVDFINLVFSQNSVPHNFKRLCPRWIRPELTGYNIAALRDGRIRSLVMAAPAEVHIAGHTLKAVGIGNVSTHLDERRTGLMQMCMTRTIDEMKEQNVDFSFLGGLRQRYNFFGYERCGYRFGFTLYIRNLRMTRGEAPAYTFRKVKCADDPALPDIRALYEAQPLRVNRGDDMTFFRTLQMWTCDPYVCTDADGRFIGYVCARPDAASLNEVFAVTDDAVLDLLNAWITQHNPNPVGLGQPLSIGIHPWARGLQRKLYAVSEGISVAPDHQYRVFNWDRVTAAFFALKATYAALPDGHLTLGIEGWGNLSISVTNGQAVCEKTDAAADIMLTDFEALRFVFGPLPSVSVKAVDPKFEPLLEAWFPLPLAWHGQDNV